ncbi:MAG: MFS transporter [Haloferacaceae archaeon]
MERSERLFGVTIAAVHGTDHLLKRLFPPLVPVWAAAFGYPLWKLGLVVGALTFGSAVGQAPIGHLSDRFDRRYLLPTGVGLIGVGVGALALVPLLGIDDGATVAVAGYRFSTRLLGMLAAMFVAGLGSASVHPTGYPLISANVSSEHKGTVLGMWGSASKFGDGLAPAFVGVLLLALAWHGILLAFAALAVLIAVVLFVVLGRFETRPASRTEAGDEADASMRRLWQTDGRVYLYPLTAVFAYFAVQIMAASGVTVFLPEFIDSVYGYTVTVAGTSFGTASTASFYFSGMLIVAGVVQLGTGRLVDRYDERLVILAYLGVAAAVLAVLGTAVLSPPVLLAALVVLGASLYGVNPARDALVGTIAPAELEGRTFGYLWTVTLLGSSVTPALVGYLGDVAGLQRAFLLLAGGVLLSALPVALLLSDRVYLVPGERRDAARAD